MFTTSVFVCTLCGIVYYDMPPLPLSSFPSPFKESEDLMCTEGESGIGGRPVGLQAWQLVPRARQKRAPPIFRGSVATLVQRMALAIA